MKKILITGIAGFIGKSLVPIFVRAGYQVYGLSRKKRSSVEFKIYQTNYTPNNIKRIIVNLRPDILIHCAGSASVENSIKNPAKDFSSSVLLFNTLLEGIRHTRHRPLIIFPSSAAVYGNQTKYPIAENTQLEPISPYGCHKAICEILAKEYAICYDMRVVILRIFSLFGEGQKRLLIWDLYRQFKKCSKVTVDGSGKEIRDYLSIDYLGEILIKLIQAIKTNYEIYNIASGKSISVKKLAYSIKKTLSSRNTISFANRKRIGHPLVWQADVSKVQKSLGEAFNFNFEKSLTYTLKQWEKQKF